jgi:N-ethylmaleimide reductase
VVETARQACDAIGAERVGIRVSPAQPVNDMADDEPRETTAALMEALSPLGLAYVHVMEAPRGTGWSAVDLVRSHFAGTVIANANFGNAWEIDDANQVLADGRADLIAFGRRFLANPDLVERVRVGAPLNEADPSTFYGGGAEGYIDYPMLEADAAMAPPSR